MQSDYQKQMDQGLNALSQAPQQEDPLMSLMRAYVQAKRAFDAACQDHMEVSQRRAVAEKQLHELSEKVAGVVQSGVYDPTCPQPGTTQVAVGTGYANGANPARR